MVDRRSALSGLFFAPLLGAHTGSRLASWSDRLVGAARRQIGVTTRYDGAYVALSYPGGDVPRQMGVCTDVVVRAYRDGLTFDLQQAIYEDMAAQFDAYPDNWGLTRPDPSIDHRRVPNLETWFARQGAEHVDLAWQAGDLMTGRLKGNGLPHIAVVSAPPPANRPSLGPRLIHNIGRGTEEAYDAGFFNTLRRFRFAPPSLTI